MERPLIKIVLEYEIHHDGSEYIVFVGAYKDWSQIPEVEKHTTRIEPKRRRQVLQIYLDETINLAAFDVINTRRMIEAGLVEIE